ncbi:MAG TPA: hypothetical protein DHV36_18795, partial [Desulfobacteraceae bacterium]|nr:hypothetical protein [Desulfobacteraceae bacterium]
SLPTYPFEKERYWMTDDAGKPAPVDGLRRHLLRHPLMHENTSDLTEQRFSATFTGEEFFLADHRIGGRPMLPGAAYLEMARAAIVQASAVPADEPVKISCKNVVWARPVTVEKEPVELHISLFPEETGEAGDIGWEVWSSGNADLCRVVHSRGTARVDRAFDPVAGSLSGMEDIRSRCSIHKAHDALYGTGVNGSAPASFMCINELFVNENGEEALALLELPAHLDDTFGTYGLHPSLLNGAFETCVFGLHPEIAQGETVLSLFEQGEAAVPYALEEIDIRESLLPKRCWAHAVLIGDGDVKTFDISLFDEAGNLLARLDRFAARALPRGKNVSLTAASEGRKTVFHPMIDRVTIDNEAAVFFKRFTGDEFYFTDHVVAGKRVLPGTAYLEMVQAAVTQAAGMNEETDVTPVMILENVVWTRPVVQDTHPVDVHLRLDRHTLDATAGTTAKMGYEIFTPSAGDRKAVVYSRGSVLTDIVEKIPALKISELKSQCNQHRVSADTCYHAFENIGLTYGPGHRGIDTLHVGEGQVLARLALPEAVFETQGSFTLHPGLMDAALQAAIGLMIGPDMETTDAFDLKPAVPFALERLEIYGRCPSAMWAHVRHDQASDNGVQKIDIDVCDDTGRICARLKGFATKTFKDPATGTLLLAPAWQENAVDAEAAPVKYEGQVVFLVDDFREQADAVRHALPDAAVILLTSKKKQIGGRFETYALQLFTEIQKIVREKSAGTQLVQLVIPGGGENYPFTGLAGLLKSAQMETSTLCCQTIALDGTPDIIPELLRDNAGCPGDQMIRYADGKRLVAGFESAGETGALDTLETTETAHPWTDRGVYLITGGAGGLGRIFAREIASRVTDPAIILTGRSEPGSSVAALLAELEKIGARAEYLQADVGKKADVRKLINGVVKTYGTLNGIIHSAGMIRDNVIAKKTRQDVKAVLAPKVAGLANIDEASCDLALDLFIVFSSAAGAMGNIGQADYACANAFMDAYAEYRDGLVAAGRRSGKTLSVNWPLWEKGGMRVDDETLKLLNMSLGMTALETKAGIAALYHSLDLDLARTLVARGRIAKLRQKLLAPTAPAAAAAPSSADNDVQSLSAAVTRRLALAVSKMMKIRIEKIDPKEELGSYGFDSISLTELTNTINELWGLELQPTLFFEYPTLEGYAAYLMDAHASELAPQFAGTKDPEKGPEPGTHTRAPAPERTRARFISQRATQQDKAKADTSVAIVGISGRFPMAEDVDAFWKNLEEGRHCITEIPEDRWDWRRFAGDAPDGDTGVRWGGFIDGVGDFDPMFFGISPREAELMDPQQRLMMLYVWKALEDAGIAPGTLSQTPTGVFISPGLNEYMHLPGFPQNDPYAPMGLAISGIPNRISYVLNLRGPSEYCETACSSALVALHRAIAAMRMGECEQAILGAVNLLLSPDGFAGVNAFGHLSPHGKPKSFQADADGYVRSEGVGAMIIKPLDKAVRDNDRIYAVIRGTGIAHGGKGMSLTAPTGSG